VLYSRKKHKIILDDSDETPGITVEDMNGNVIHIDSKKNKLTMKGDVSVESKGKMTLKATKGIDIDGGAGEVKVKGTFIKLNDPG
jgi:lipopolysaccharide export system protein LptA